MIYHKNLESNKWRHALFLFVKFCSMCQEGWNTKKDQNGKKICASSNGYIPTSMAGENDLLNHVEGYYIMTWLFQQEVYVAFPECIAVFSFCASSWPIFPYVLSLPMLCSPFPNSICPWQQSLISSVFGNLHIPTRKKPEVKLQLGTTTKSSIAWCYWIDSYHHECHIISSSS